MQGILNLGDNYQDNPNDFMVSYSNFEAHNAILNWDKWHRLLIIGPPKSGKTLLAKIWQKNTGAVFFNNTENVDGIEYNEKIIIDNIEDFSEEILINIINFANEKSFSLLLTGVRYPSFLLRDLNSRIKATYKVVIKEPDEALLKLLIIKLFKQKQIGISEEIINFILSNVERSYELIYEVISLLDKLSKIAKRKITLPFVRAVVAKYYLILESAPKDEFKTCSLFQ